MWGLEVTCIHAYICMAARWIVHFGALILLLLLLLLGTYNKWIHQLSCNKTLSIFACCSFSLSFYLFYWAALLKDGTPFAYYDVFFFPPLRQAIHTYREYYRIYWRLIVYKMIICNNRRDKKTVKYTICKRFSIYFFLLTRFSYRSFGLEKFSTVLSYKPIMAGPSITTCWDILPM